jgi:hypothetical protein
MELDQPTPVSHSPSQGTRLYWPAVYPPQKYICKYKKLAKFGKITFLFQKSENEFNKLTFYTSEFVDRKI